MTTQPERTTAGGQIPPWVGRGDGVTRDQWDAHTAEIARLMDVADNEDAAIRQLEACVADLRRVHAAKAALRAFTPSEHREAVDFRRERARESAS
jgi:hypothetical protein